MAEKPPEKSWTHPRVYVANAINDLKASKDSHLKAADEISQSITVLETGQDYWNRVDPGPFISTPSGVASIDYLNMMASEASAIRVSGEDSYRLARIMNTTSGSYGTITTTAATVICKVESFDTSQIKKAIEKPHRDEEYTHKFETFDPELGKLYGQILQVKMRTSSHPGKSILPDVRQAYDHLMRVLAPDPKVRAEPGWKPEDPKKPEMVTRPQRLVYSAKHHIHDDTLRATILATTKHILALHDDLNELYHTEKPLDVDKAFAVSEAMIEVLNEWADAIGL
jgi:hypothetical protein